MRRGNAPVARIAPLERKRGGVTGRGSMRDEIAIADDVGQADREIERLFDRREIFPLAQAHVPTQAARRAEA